jgi:hypothetical protein
VKDVAPQGLLKGTSGDLKGTSGEVSMALRDRISQQETAFAGLHGQWHTDGAAFAPRCPDREVLAREEEAFASAWIQATLRERHVKPEPAEGDAPTRWR